VLTPENASAVAAVCRRLDGLPLAIELAAARVKAMSPAELARGLDHRFETLAGGRRGAVQRRQTLRAAIDWSYDLLTEPERRLLARMSVFAGGCTRESAEAVCAGDPIDASRSFSLLSTLVDRSLVVVERGDPATRYRLLETIREYGEERLAEHGETDAVRRRHAEHYDAYARRLYEKARGPEEPEALRLLGAERENLLAAMASAVDSGDVDVALRLLTARGGMVFWFNLQRLPVDALRLKGVAEHPFYPRALVTAACYAVLSGDARGWEELADAALSAAERLAEPDPVVGYLLQWARARMAQYLGLEAASAAHAVAAAEIARSAGLLPELASQLGAAGIALAGSGGSDRAEPLAREALALARQLGAPSLIASALKAWLPSS